MMRNYLWQGAVLVLALSGCEPKKHAEGVYQGYLEGRFLNVAAPVEGQLQDLRVRRGDWVEAGAPLFSLEPEPQTQEVREAEQRVTSAQAKLDDFKKGMRDSELEMLEAELKADRTQLDLANLEYKRSQPLKDSEFVSAHEFDRLRLLVDQRSAQVDHDTAQLATGKLGAREDQIREATADLAAAEAARDRARWFAGEKTQTAPQPAYVQDTLFRVGERVDPGQSVVVLLPAAELRARFFVPQPEINKIKAGQEVTVILDGLPPQKARVGFISTEVEFTPPVIYSPEENHKYVFMVEADFDPAVARTLHPGQPAEVRLTP